MYDSNEGCTYPSSTIPPVPDQYGYVGSTVPLSVDFSHAHCQGIPMTVSSDDLPSFVENTAGVLIFNPSLNTQVGEYMLSVTLKDPLSG